MKTDGIAKKNFKKGYKTGRYRKSNAKSVPVKKTIQTMIKKEIAKNIENKYTGTVIQEQSVLQLQVEDSTPTYTWFTFNPYNQTMFQLASGTDQNERIGNKIKLKRYVIKGSVFYDYNYDLSNNPYYLGSQMYVDVYIGRLNNEGQVQSDLPGLLQQGPTTHTPVGQLSERTMSVNRDDYKVYWHKRFKVGNTLQASNNDYSLNEDFGVDLCKLCCKNKILKYSDEADTNNDPNDSLISSLTMWAVGTSPTGDITTDAQITLNVFSPVKIVASAYAEYEDA